MIRIALLDPYPVVHKGFKSFFKKTPHISMEKAFTLTQDLFEFIKEWAPGPIPTYGNCFQYLEL